MAAQTYIQQLSADTGCSPEDQPEAMDDRERWRERVRSGISVLIAWLDDKTTEHVKHEGDADNNRRRSALNGSQRFRKKKLSFRISKEDHIIVEFGRNNPKNHGELWRLAVLQSNITNKPGFEKPARSRIIKERNKRDKYLDLARELKKKMWNVKMTVIPIVIGTLWTVPKGLEMALESWKSKN